jgi:hypothetical protein
VERGSVRRLVRSDSENDQRTVCRKIVRLKKHTNLESGYDTRVCIVLRGLVPIDRDIDCRSQEGVTS